MINQFDDINSFNYSFSKASGCVGVIGRSGEWREAGGRAARSVRIPAHKIEVKSGN